DDDQAIYGWRGASVDNLAQLPLDYPTLKVIKLEQNYRSTTRILRSANALIANNPKLHAKKLWSEHGHGDAIRVPPAIDDEADAEARHRRNDARPAGERGVRGKHQSLRRCIRRANGGGDSRSPAPGTGCLLQAHQQPALSGRTRARGKTPRRARRRHWLRGLSF